jgi:16S rRNA (cytosine967-C5)-methyltransferase
MYKGQHNSRVSRGGSLSANPRRVALAVLRSTAEGGMPEEVLNSDGVMLSQKDMNLASNLVYTCVRHQSRLDFLIDGKLEAAENTPQTVRIVLRMGLAQLLFFDRMAFHAVVNETTELAKKFAPGREGLVNAVLRSFIRDIETHAYWPKEIDGKETPLITRLSTLYSYPDWLVAKLVERWGLRDARAFLVASNQPVPATIRVNTQLTTREDLAKLLPFETTKTKYSPWGLLPNDFAGKLFSWPGYKEGLFAIQDEASQLMALLAKGDKDPSTVFDVCAGLGGKTFNILNVFPKAQVLALDKSEDRLRSLQQEARRLRVSSSIRIITNDILNLDIYPRFDLVMVDAPCSGLGVIRRRPDLKWKKSPSDVYRYANLQRSILSAASRAVYPGGKLIYSVCTIMDEEGPDVVKAFLEEKGDYYLDNTLSEDLSPLISEPGQLRILPHHHAMDGFYYAVFKRRS